MNTWIMTQAHKGALNTKRSWSLLRKFKINALAPRHPPRPGIQIAGGQKIIIWKAWVPAPMAGIPKPGAPTAGIPKPRAPEPAENWRFFEKVQNELGIENFPANRPSGIQKKSPRRLAIAKKNHYKNCLKIKRLQSCRCLCQTPEGRHIFQMLLFIKLSMRRRHMWHHFGGCILSTSRLIDWYW